MLAVVAAIALTGALASAAFASVLAEAAGAAASVSIVQAMLPTATVSPAGTFILRMPLFSAFKESMALSDWISANASSISTYSPSCLSQVSITTSVTDSPGLGIFISTIISFCEWESGLFD